MIVHIAESADLNAFECCCLLVELNDSLTLTGDSLTFTKACCMPNKTLECHCARLAKLKHLSRSPDHQVQCRSPPSSDEYGYIDFLVL